MTFKVDIEQWETIVQVETGQTILEAALTQGVPYPYGCRFGNCGTCRSKLIEGTVEMAKYSDFALSTKERERGFVLACRASPTSDSKVAWREPDEFAAHPYRELTCRVFRIEAVTHDIKRILLDIESGGPFRFSAGQYVEFGAGGLAPRHFSMANRPVHKRLEFHVRRVSGGEASCYVCDHLKEGEIVRITGPFGSSYLRENHRGPILAIAGGTGLAPVKSIVESALFTGTQQPIYLYFGVRQERDLYLHDLFAQLAQQHNNFTFIPVLSEADAGNGRRTGLVHDAVAADFESFDDFKAYLAGPPVMVEAAAAMLTERGMRREDIHADAFYTSADLAAADAR